MSEPQVKKKRPSRAQFDLNGIRIETRGRPKKKPTMALHWKTRAAQEEATPKLLEIQKVIDEHFGGIRDFLHAWLSNPASKTQYQNFMIAGAKEMIELWLPNVKVEPVDLMVSRVQSYVIQEVEELMRDQKSVLRYIQQRDGDAREGMAELGMPEGCNCDFEIH